MSPSDSLRLWLRGALGHLYEPSMLQRNPLIRLLGLANSRNPSADLREFLIREIRSMAPRPGTPSDSELYRIHEVLYCRYVQHCSQLEVADQLGLSTRQLRRVERKALDALATRLEARLAETPSVPAPVASPQGLVPAADVSSAKMVLTRELAWLTGPAARGPASISELIPSLLKSVSALAQRYRVKLDIAPAVAGLPLVAVHPVALKQILLGATIAVMRAGDLKRITVKGNASDTCVEVCVEGAGQFGDAYASIEGEEDLQSTLDLAERCGAQIAVERTDDRVAVLVRLPGVQQLPVLVLDDNSETRRLFERYAVGTRYRVIGVGSLPEALARAEQLAPSVIVLDVMMPQMDGWEVLAQLRQHPLTAKIPIAVCTILTQEELAFALGAASFLRKPVSRQSFLEMLDQLTSLQAGEAKQLPASSSPGHGGPAHQSERP